MAATGEFQQSLLMRAATARTVPAATAGATARALIRSPAVVTPPTAAATAPGRNFRPMASLASARNKPAYSARSPTRPSSTRVKRRSTPSLTFAHEYTFTQEQADIAKRLLERVQKTPSAAEIQSGKSLNILLDDLVKFNNQQIKGPTINLDEDVLKLVNITGAGSGSANIGLLRDSGRVNWPGAFDNKEVISEKDRNDLTLEAKQLYELAATGQPNVNIVRNVESALQTLRKNLTKQVDNVPSKSYLEGQRFLDDFDAAVVAVKKGDVVLNLDFQQKFVKDGKRSTQELVEYMGGKGLRFAPASVGDDRAYVALQGALSAQSIVIHSQVASSGKAY